MEIPDFTTEDVMAEKSPEAKKLLLELFPELDSSAEIPLPNIKIESKEYNLRMSELYDISSSQKYRGKNK